LTSARIPPPVVLAKVALLVALATLSSACQQTNYLTQVAARTLSSGGASASGPEPFMPEVAGVNVSADLPPPQVDPGFDFEPMDPAENGNLQYRVRIKQGGSPALVALGKLTPLFALDGKDAPEYVSEQFFAANPHRTPFSIQPGDRFILSLPPNTFVVRWAEERQEFFGGPANLREYVSERGDLLRYYLTDRFPVRYEMQDISRPGVGVVRFSSDLPFLLSTGRADQLRLAQLVYRVNDPDLFQLEQMRSLIAGLTLGEESTLEVDRRRTYMDPVREVIPKASEAISVTTPSRAHLTRYTFTLDSRSPYAAVEDALGTHTSISELASSQVFRIEYGWDGSVRVYYRTGADDARGKRDPFELREDDRWAQIYDSLGHLPDPPVKWGVGQPSDLDPFPSARDPQQRTEGGEPSYDFLVPGRALVLTFLPTRLRSDARAEQEFRSNLREMQEQLRGGLDQTSWIMDFVDASRREPLNAAVVDAETGGQSLVNN